MTELKVIDIYIYMIFLVNFKYKKVEEGAEGNDIAQLHQKSAFNFYVLNRVLKSVL